MYAEPCAASARFYNYGELLAARSRELRRYGTDGTTITRDREATLTVTEGDEEFELENEDFNVRSLRSSVVLRWEWRAGSTLFLVWQQDTSAFTERGNLVRPSALWDAVSTDGDNFLAVKVSYWLPLY
jgi:hypothetical protein